MSAESVDPTMSGWGHVRTPSTASAMSAIGPKADISVGIEGIRVSRYPDFRRHQKPNTSGRLGP
jgi:hypothetical protein